MFGKFFNALWGKQWGFHEDLQNKNQKKNLTSVSQSASFLRLQNISISASSNRGPGVKRGQSVRHVPLLHNQSQQSCKPHWPGSVIHTHYYFTGSGTAALTAPVSPSLIRDKAASHTEAFSGLPFQSASTGAGKGPDTDAVAYTHVYNYWQIHNTARIVSYKGAIQWRGVYWLFQGE